MIKELLVSFFGAYSPIYTEVNGVYTIPSGAAGVDWVWIAGVVVFLTLLYLVITIIRMVFR